VCPTIVVHKIKPDESFFQLIYVEELISNAGAHDTMKAFNMTVFLGCIWVRIDLMQAILLEVIPQ
jgi:hypothetical protein